MVFFHIPENRLKVKGYGEYRIIAQGNDEACHAINRRVEITRSGKMEKAAKAEAPVFARENQLSMDVGFLYKDGKSGLQMQIRSDGTSVLRTDKDPYQIFFRPHQNCYVYLLQKDSAGQWYILFPEKGSGFNINPVSQGKDYWVPGFDKEFPLDKTKGEETIYLLASMWQVSDLESPGSNIEELVIPITRSFQTRGVSHIGKPRINPRYTVSKDYETAIERFTGTGSFSRTISFIHQ